MRNPDLMNAETIQLACWIATINNTESQLEEFCVSLKREAALAAPEDEAAIEETRERAAKAIADLEHAAQQLAEAIPLCKP